MFCVTIVQEMLANSTDIW